MRRPNIDAFGEEMKLNDEVILITRDDQSKCKVVGFTDKRPVLIENKTGEKAYIHSTYRFVKLNPGK